MIGIPNAFNVAVYENLNLKVQLRDQPKSPERLAVPSCEAMLRNASDWRSDAALKSLGIYNDGRMYEWSDERGRGYTAYVAETPTGELIEIH